MRRRAAGEPYGLSFCCVSTVFLFKTPFRAVLLSQASWVAEDDERGWAVHDVYERNGALSADALARWWLEEDMVLFLEGFIAAALPTARRVERQNLRLTYAIGGGGGGGGSGGSGGGPRRPQAEMVAAPEIFRAAEAARQECNVAEYGVAQGSLEQVRSRTRTREGH
eukprot:SAG22_NODE_932_length_6448_cov_7.053709_6_plen_167_part_00